MRLRGAVALVTGGSSGIGAATARCLAAAGARLLIAGRDPRRLDAVARDTGGLAVEADLGAPDGPAELAEAALAMVGKLPGGSGAEPGSAGPGGADPGDEGIDILVNNAGIGWCGPLPDMDAGKIAEILAVNLAAPIELTRRLLPEMTARGRGRIVFVSSIAGATAVPGEAVYSAAKAGLSSFAECLGRELHGSGVRVSVVVPGVINTPFFDRRGRPYGRKLPVPLPAERAAEAIRLALERDLPEVYVPGWMRVPARLHGAAPGLFGSLATWFGHHG
jgi:NAD(P)-dependent dehydrogenase (short-subunit alcohol dehydrogenase family)